MKKFALMLVLSALLSACGTDEVKSSHFITTMYGMPCLVVNNYNYHAGANVQSITCDWSKYDPTQDK